MIRVQAFIQTVRTVQKTAVATRAEALSLEPTENGFHGKH